MSRPADTIRRNAAFESEAPGVLICSYLRLVIRAAHAAGLPEAYLAELTALLDPPIGTSGIGLVNH